MCNTTTTMLHTLQTFKNDIGSNWKKKAGKLAQKPISGHGCQQGGQFSFFKCKWTKESS